MKSKLIRTLMRLIFRKSNFQVHVQSVSASGRSGVRRKRARASPFLVAFLALLR